MGNLGWYQKITSWSKSLGGPQNLLILTAIGGYGVIRGIEAVGKKTLKSVKKKKSISKNRTYKVMTPGESNEGLRFNPDDEFRVLEVDGDAVLIEKIGDKNNPYFVDRKLLSNISDYI